MSFDFGPMMELADRATLGFVGITPRGPQGHPAPISRGSGTLVHVGKVSGILTCAHVAADVLSWPKIGILSFPARADARQAAEIVTQHMAPIISRAPNWNKRGPDLAFLRIPITSVGDILRHSNSIDLARHVNMVEPRSDYRFELVAGVIDLWTHQQIVGPTTLTTPFEGLLNVGISAACQRPGGERFRFKPDPQQRFILPRSYKGTSGGGLWRFFTRRFDDQRYEPIDQRLIGVPYYEIGNKVVIGHGLQDLSAILARVRAQWPSET